MISRSLDISSYKMILSECLWGLTALGIFIKWIMRHNNIFKNTQGLETAWLVFITVLSIYLLDHFSFTTFLFNNRWMVSPLINFAKISGIIVTFLFLKPLEDQNMEIYKLEYRFLMLVNLIGLFFTLSSNDLICLYLGLEIQALCLYIIIGIFPVETLFKEIKLKAFILGGIGSAVLLYGLSLIYGFSGGDVSYMAIHQAFRTPQIGLIAGMIFVLTGLFFRLSIFPFHFGIDKPSSRCGYLQFSLLTIFSTLSSVVILVRFKSYIFSSSLPILYFIESIAFLFLLIGAFGGLLQTKLKPLMAYSHLHHIGFLLLGLLTATPNNTGIIIYLITYLLPLLGSLILFMSIKYQDQDVESLSDLKGLAQIYPKVALLLTIFLGSLAGLPFVAGFWGKYYILLELMKENLRIISVLSVLLSLISTFYYIRIIKIMYFGNKIKFIDIRINNFSNITTYFIFIFTILFFFIQNWILPYLSILTK